MSVRMCFIQHSWVSPLSFFQNLQLILRPSASSDLRGETHISPHLVCIGWSTQQGEVIVQGCTGGLLTSTAVPVNAFFLISNFYLQHKPVVPFFLSLLCFHHFLPLHSLWHFFLPHNLLPVFSILNPIHLCLWRGTFIYLDRLPKSCTSALNSGHTSTTPVGKDILNATKIRRDFGHPYLLLHHKTWNLIW